MPIYLDRIRSVINELPSNFNFKVPLLLEESGLSQDLKSYYVLQLFIKPESLLGGRSS